MEKLQGLHFLNVEFLIVERLEQSVAIERFDRLKELERLKPLKQLEKLS